MGRADSVLLPSLVYWRLQRSFTQAKLAKRIGMNLNTVSGSKPATRQAWALLVC